MKARAILTCIASLLVFTLAVAFRSEWVDLIVRCAVGSGLLVGSVLTIWQRR